jgi:hypothetical protein
MRQERRIVIIRCRETVWPSCMCVCVCVCVCKQLDLFHSTFITVYILQSVVFLQFLAHVSLTPLFVLQNCMLINKHHDILMISLPIYMYWFSTAKVCIPGNPLKFILCGFTLDPYFEDYIPYMWAGSLSQYSDWVRAGRSENRVPEGAKFSASVQTGPGAHPASCTMGTGSFLGVEIGRGMTLTPHPLLVPRSENSRAISLFSLRAFVACEKGETYLLPILDGGVQ